MLGLRVVLVVALAAVMVQAKPSAIEELRELLEEIDEKKAENVRSLSSVGSPMTVDNVAKRGVQYFTTETVYTANGGTRTIDVAKDCVDAHNKVRRLHQNTPDLVHDEQLAAGAREWAQHLANLGTLTHSGPGENLAYTAVGNNLGSYATTPAVAVFNWYAESWQFNYNYNVNAMQSAGHFTQVVWKGTTKVGCGVATVERNGMKETYIVGRYSPAGNMIGSFTSNVEPMKPGAQRPQRAADIEDGGCANYAQKCGMFAGYGLCSHIKNDCQCSCT